MGNPKLRKTVAKALIKKKGTTAITKQLHKKKRFQNPSKINDDTMREQFDKSKSWIQNFQSVDLKKMYEDKLPCEIAAKAMWTMPKLNEDEVLVVKRLVAKHGETSFQKMAFDRKLNTFQWTAEQCEKKALLLSESKIHICEDGKCLCGCTPNSSYVSKADRIRK